MSQNPSFIRTDNAIMYAFIRLLKEKSFEKITVQDILDETPVTRGTFYAHYHDKYEIAEKMLEKYMNTRNQVRSELYHTDFQNNPAYLASKEINHEILEALLKIHTDRVDLRRAIVEEFEKEYLSRVHTRNAAVEARMFAHARAELEFSIYDDSIRLSIGQTKEIIENVVIALSHTLEHSHTEKEAD